jgi:hypothetical protein
MQKLIIFFLLGFLINLGCGAQDSALNSLITDPGISARCRQMLKERQEKLSVKQKLKALKSRAQKLLKESPKDTRQSARANVSSSLQKVKHEIVLNRLKTERMEEKIIRTGCPLPSQTL